MKNVIVLFGGRSSEYEVSLSSAYAVLSNIDRERFSVTVVGITKSGEWYLYKGPIEEIPSNQWCENGPALTPVRLDMTKGGFITVSTDGTERPVPCDVVFPVLHGACGEDGTMQGLFTVCGIPVVGCGCTASAVCMDKALTKSIVASESTIPQAKAVIALRRDIADSSAMAALQKRCETELGGYPLFVKPACSGSSVGASKVKTAAQFAHAVELAFEEGEKIMIEECITGREIEVAVLEEKGHYTVSSPAEIDIGSSEFYDYETKYISDASSYYIPARISEEATEVVRRYAERIFKILGCRGLSRVDFFCTGEEHIVFNEINTIPGFTPISMYPRLMIHAGISYSDLITRLLEGAMA